VADSTDRLELQRRLDQSRRLAAEPNDPLTKERLNQLVRDLEGELRLKLDAPVQEQCPLRGQSRQFGDAPVKSGHAGPR
jgi:hypothetical protein